MIQPQPSVYIHVSRDTNLFQSDKCIGAWLLIHIFDNWSVNIYFTLSPTLLAGFTALGSPEWQNKENQGSNIVQENVAW